MQRMGGVITMPNKHPKTMREILESKLKYYQLTNQILDLALTEIKKLIEGMKNDEVHWDELEEDSPELNLMKGHNSALDEVLKMME